MANKQLVNGKVYDWSSVTITASGMENMEPMEISYDDEQESEPIYGKGGKIRGYGTGNQKNSVKLSLIREDFNEMCRVIKSKGYKNFYKCCLMNIMGRKTFAFRRTDSNSEYNIDIESNGVEVIVE